jgi:hypothetical protein
MRKVLLTLLFLPIGCMSLKAQDEKTGEPKSETSTIKMVISGDAFTGLKYVNDPNNSNNNKFTFTTTGVNPVFLWKVTDKMLFEGEVEFQNRGNNAEGAGFAVGEGLEIELEYCNIAYFINKYMTLRAGTYFSSEGVFEDWYHQRITNRMTSRPLGIGHGGLESGTSLGLNLRGAIPIGSAKFNYSLDFTNAPTLLSSVEAGTDSVSAMKAAKAQVGQLEYEVITDKRLTKQFGGRIGLLPFGNNALEIGFSYKTGKVGARGTKYEDVSSNFMAVDLSIVKDLEFLKGTINFRSQYDQLSVDKAVYSYSFVNSAGKTVSYDLPSFDNNTNAYYLQLSYRPTMVTSKVLKKMELTGRYCSQTIPTGVTWTNDAPSGRTYGYKSQVGVTLGYWLAWNAVVKLAYEQNQWADYKSGSAAPGATYIAQFALGF